MRLPWAALLASCASSTPATTVPPLFPCLAPETGRIPMGVYAGAVEAFDGGIAVAASDAVTFYETLTVLRPDEPAEVLVLDTGDFGVDELVAGGSSLHATGFFNSEVIAWQVVYVGATGALELGTLLFPGIGEDPSLAATGDHVWSPMDPPDPAPRASGTIHRVDAGELVTVGPLFDAVPEEEGGIDAMATDGHILALASSPGPDGWTWLSWLDVSEPEAPVPLGAWSLDDLRVDEVAVVGSHLVVTRESLEDLLVIVDISEPSAPVERRVALGIVADRQRLKALDDRHVLVVRFPHVALVDVVAGAVIGGWSGDRDAYPLDVAVSDGLAWVLLEGGDLVTVDFAACWTTRPACATCR